MTAPADGFYHEGSRGLQRAFGTVGLADHIANRYVLKCLTADHIGWIRGADAVYVATVDPAGYPDCSYKGGLPGFVVVPDPYTIEIPSYDGNGMYRTLGNAASVRRIGLLFVVAAVPAKLRVSGSCEVITRPAALAGHPGAEAVLRINVHEAFENCPRYLHDRVSGTHSVHCPRPDHVPPDPDWKLKPEYESLLPSRSLPR